MVPAAELTDRLLLEEQLVLADALQDGGDPRGHLLALHLAIERAPDDQTLVAAAKDHVAEHAEDLIGPLAPYHGDPGLTLEWHRGYVKGASLDTKDTPACLDALLQIPMVHTLTDLRLGRAAGCLPVLAAHRPHLRHLEYGIDALGRPVLDAPDLTGLWQALPTLQSFVGGAQRLGRLEVPALRSLDLRSPPADLVSLLDARWPTLVSLRLQGAIAGPYARGYDVRSLLDALDQVPSIRELAITFRVREPDPPTFSMFMCVGHLIGSRLRRLRRLELRGAVGWDAHAAIDRFPSEFAHLDEFLIVDRSAPANRQTPAESSADACRIHPSAGNARCSPT
ncbi:MAG: hypothetical protein JNL79_28775 [Myxococcales bacterium]|nr:hypothetical protein [Myxococcales bacterium]